MKKYFYEELEESKYVRIVGLGNQRVYYKVAVFKLFNLQVFKYRIKS